MIEGEENEIETALETTPRKKLKLDSSSKKSHVRDYFEVASRSTVKCNLCENEIKHQSSAMRRHLKMNHQIIESHNDAASDASGDSLSEADESEVSEYLEQADDSSDFEEALKEKPKRKDRNINVKKEWIWGYYEALSNNSAQCKICKSEIAGGTHSTTEIHNHLRTIHQITEPPKHIKTECAETTATTRQNRSWVWQHFKKISTKLSSCNVCSKVMIRGDSSTTGMKKHLRTHDIDENSEASPANISPSFVQDLSESCEKAAEVKCAAIIKESAYIKQRSSWVWRHFQYISSSKASCKVCAKVISRGDCSTSGMKKHLRLHGLFEGNSADETLENFIEATAVSPNVKFDRPHSSTSSSGIPNHVKLQKDEQEAANPGEYQADTKQRSSFVWRYFQLISSTIVKCNICERVLQRINGSTSNMRKHLKTHDIDTSDTKTAPIEFKSVPKPPQLISHSKDTCYICNGQLSGSFKSELSNVSSTTETPLYEILENFTGAELSQTEIDGSSVCQKCFTSLEKYDDLLHQSQEISNNLTALLQKTHSGQVFIKAEPEFEDEVIQESSSQSFRENHPRRSLSESRNFMDNEEQMDEDSSDYNNDEISHSETRADETDKIDKADKMKVEEEIRANGVAECSTCKAIFKRSKNYFRHIQIHKLKDESLFCKTCSRNFKTKSSFQMHLATDHDRGTGPFDCPVCLKTFAEKKNLKAHFYIHTREETILCWQCGATFLQKKSLEMHLMAHDDIRPFECTIPGCAKKFRTSGKLNVHIRVHNGEKIYECPQCPGHRFAQQWGLDLHLKKQHNFEATPRVACKICGVKVMSKSKMKIHLQNIHDVVDDNDGIDLMDEF